MIPYGLEQVTGLEVPHIEVGVKVFLCLWAQEDLASVGMAMADDQLKNWGSQIPRQIIPWHF